MFLIKSSSFTHFVKDQFYLTYDVKYSTSYSSRLVKSRSQSTPVIPTATYTALQKQIINRQVGFDFLTDIELTSLLTSVLSRIEKSYQITDITESLNLFSQFIVAQSVYVLRSCATNQRSSSNSHSCLIVSTMYLRPLIEINKSPIVYKLIPIPAIVNDEQYIYTNMPEMIAININDQSAMLWSSASTATQCIFSIFVYCQKKQPMIKLPISPCLSELFNNSTHSVNSCQISRSREIQNSIINVDNDIWIFSFNQRPLQCHVEPSVDKFNSIISINDPSIIRVPCNHTITCTNVIIPPATCKNRKILVKSTTTDTYEETTTFSRPLNTMTNHLLSAYKTAQKNLMKDISSWDSNQYIITKYVKELVAIVPAIFFLLLLSITLFFIRWIKRMVQKRIDKLEKDVDDLVHELV